MRRILIALALILTAAQTASAQRTPEPQGGDAFAKYFYPPELVMQHQSELGLTDAQRSTITTALQQAQSKFIEVQFKLAAEAEKMGKLVQKASVDETQALEQADRVLALERELKRAQITLIVRIKNTLTAQQQAKLNDMRGGKEE